ncbi:MAG: sugar ABC transporter permease [Mollicutes bacterium]|nr:sugar ABC transporter permease [Mollicutes bacterium]MDD7264431.1 sugar ABC transporter permease [bacterium]MDY4979375.1 sugar ABC transporter permease [Candidatus Onthovivens sp.]
MENSNILDQTLYVRKRKWYMPEWCKAWIALIPALFFLIIFMIYPILNTICISFIENFTWVGKSGSSFALSNFFAAMNNPRINTMYFNFNNYINVLKDTGFKDALFNTIMLVIVQVPLTILIGLLIAVALNSIKPLKAFFQTVFFLPYVTNTIALGVVFSMMFSSGAGGLINTIAGWFGGNPVSWMNNKWTMFFVLTVYSIWNGLAFKILVFSSGLATIDKQYYDAARIDGSSKFTIFRRITVPLLSPQILYITVTSFIGAFKAYSQIISLVGGGATNFGGSDHKMWITVVGYIYYYQNDKIGQASAAAVILLLIILLITGVQMLVSKKRVHY